MKPTNSSENAFHYVVGGAIGLAFLFFLYKFVMPTAGFPVTPIIIAATLIVIVVLLTRSYPRVAIGMITAIASVFLAIILIIVEITIHPPSEE
jgi:hypothetical protein